MLGDAKSRLIEGAARLLQTSAAQKVLQDDRVMKVLVGALSARRTIRRITDAQIAQVARRLRLATREDVQSLRAAVERLEAAVGQGERRSPSEGP